MSDIPKHLKKRLVPPVYFLAVIVAMRLLHTYAPVKTIIEDPFRWAGVAVILAGLILAIAGNRMFVRQNTPLRPFEKSTTLVTTGVFSLSRNPMYLGFTLVLVGMAVKQGTLSAMLIQPLFPLIIEWLFIRTEEKLLEENFGQAYVGYRQRVRRWV